MTICKKEDENVVVGPAKVMRRKIKLSCPKCNGPLGDDRVCTDCDIEVREFAQAEITLNTVRSKLMAIGIVIKKCEDEYRVNFRNGREATAYYTNDLEDALNTGIAMKDAPR